tara:strand:+ start:322 stop:954 length:633 start_codon:yes stop_codon:yes gene_type:complete
MKKLILLILMPLFILSQDFEYKPKKEIIEYEFAPLWTVAEKEGSLKILYNLFGDSYFGLSYFGNSFKTNVGLHMLKWTFIIEKSWDNEDLNDGDQAIILSTSFDYMIDSNAYSFDTPSNELGTGFISINMQLIDQESVNGNRPTGSLSFGWLVFDNDKTFHKGGNVKSFKVMGESKVGGNLWVNGGFYFDKDKKTNERHDLPFFGLSYRF